MFDLPVIRRPSGSAAGHRARVLFVGHAGSPTGFARVLHSLLCGLADRYDVHHFGTNLRGAAPACGWRVYDNGGGDGPGAAARAADLARTIEPDLLFVLDDVRGAARYRDLPESCGAACASVFHAIVDGRQPFALEDVAALAGFDSVVTCTQFGRAEIEAAARDVRARTAELRLPPMAVIPHGLDRDLFRPVGRRHARRVLFPDRRDLDDAFIALNANRNQRFKRIDITMEGFARFARGRPPGVFLYLHMATAAAGPGVAPLADALGIRDRLLVTTAGDRHPELSSERLNLVYSACDVGVNTSEGEGWGLVSFEHAAAGAAQIVPRHTACAELWAGAALFLEPVTADAAEGDRRAGRTVTPDAVAEALERAYRDRRRLGELSRAAYRNATRADRQWSHVREAWDRHFQALLSRRK